MEQETLHLIVNIVVAVTVACLGGIVAVRLRQSVIVGYLLAGILIGPFTPGVIGDLHRISAMAEIGVIFLMFVLGVEFNLGQLGPLRAVALVGTTLQVSLIALAGFGLGRAMGWNVHAALYLGGILSISSTMVILKTLLDRGELNETHGRLMLAMLIVQDLLVVVMIVALAALHAPGRDQFITLGMAMAKASVFVIATVLLGTRVVPRLLWHVAQTRSDELFALAVVTIALGTGLVSHHFGLSVALGAFLAGLMVGETEFNHRIVAQVIPFRDVFASLFFVSVGMMIDPRFVVTHIASVAIVVVLMIALKFVVSVAVVLPFGYTGRTAVAVGAGMTQIGEFSFMLAKQGLDAQVLTEAQYTLVLCAAVLSILLTPGALKQTERIDRALTRLPLLRALFGPHIEPLPLEQVDRLRDHVIVVGHGRVGGRITEALRRHHIPVTVIERDHNLTTALRQRGVPAVCGDAVYPSVVAHAHPERARVLVGCLPDFGVTQAVIENARALNPQLDIVARVTRQDEVAALCAMGAREVVEPEFEGSLELLRHTFQAYGITDEMVRAELDAMRAAMQCPAGSQSLAENAQAPTGSERSPTIPTGQGGIQ
ncbi:MAG: cation:proton antiporter [Abditibacteriales bacterium]|nr:cation:proton antiporter [Abditibacteriales bacterium]MDW8364958.1 cation:proton antiporter [Abditibacteriales bacterium]